MDKVEILEEFKGGSDSITVLAKVSGMVLPIVRKFAKGASALKLAAQADWLSRYSHHSNIPNVLEAFDRKGMFVMDLDFIENAVPLHEYLLSLDVDDAIFLLNEILNFARQQPLLRVEVPDWRQLLEFKIVGKLNQCI